MRYAVCAAIAFLAAASAEATKHTPSTPDKPVQEQSQGQQQDQSQTQTTTATQSQTANGGTSTADAASSSASSVNVEDRLQAPGTFVGAASPSAPCYVVNGWSLGVPGAGGGRSKARLDEDCVTRERARLLIDAGYPELAARLLLGEELGPEALTPRVNELREPTACEARVERAVTACAK